MRDGTGRRTGTLVAVAVVVAVLAVAAPAAAHQTANTITPVLDGLEPPVAGVEAFVQATQDATLLTLETTPGTVVEVLDEDGRPWLRIEDGTVEADLDNPAWYAATNAAGVVPEPLPGAGKGWSVVDRADRLQWFEHRLHPADLEVPDDVLASPQARDVATWSVPLRVDGTAVALTGRLRHVPVTGRVEPRLVGGRELAAGVTLDVVAGAVPAFFLRNEGDLAVTVLSPDGSPYAVVDTDGVRVNPASSTWAEQDRFAGGDEAGAAQRGGAERGTEAVAWERISASPSHTWLDGRAALPGVLPDEGVRAGGREVVLRQWEIPVRIGDELVAVAGESVWVPLGTELGAASAGTVRPEFVVAGVLGLLLLGLGLWRRRRGAQTG